ncbi:EpsI family protein [Nitrogeniibacter mangrovi]|uniref:EpsI family protein n=1 Tax=Nitrogeniibacter mangrovi TaxID=2016596 RepID=A0A6C1B1H7_9RHOO|nr:exosortase-associated protein EpsI, B-type [Nitrogeniibacter mangrovi]QID16765.1 EpsI family protein [Nitrogeniibacter mangrovi]
MFQQSGRPNSRMKAFFIALLMVVSAAFGAQLKPSVFLADLRPGTSLGELVPKQFGDWKVEPQAPQLVNPQSRELIDKLYVETVSRTYTNSHGQRVMLAIAYGRDQRDSLALHRPDVCYPAQGFVIRNKHDDVLKSRFGDIPVRRLFTGLDGRRFEPVTYWTTVGDHVVRHGYEKKLVEMEYAAKGLIPDGLLFRVSTISQDPDQAYALSDRFTRDLLHAVDPKVLPRLAGFEPAAKSR